VSNEVHVNGKNPQDLCKLLLHAIRQIRWTGVNGITRIWLRNFSTFVSPDLLVRCVQRIASGETALSVCSRGTARWA